MMLPRHQLVVCVLKVSTTTTKVVIDTFSWDNRVHWFHVHKDNRLRPCVRYDYHHVQVSWPDPSIFSFLFKSSSKVSKKYNVSELYKSFHYERSFRRNMQHK
jgi:hypothetical protein